jgi:competence protein ComEC
VLERLVAEAVAVGVIVERVDARSPPGRIGNITLRPLGPIRRYAADNDVSIVLRVEARRTLLLAGDVEAVAQRELPALRPDVLLVPHHGSATTDVQWLAETLGETAVVSVGENAYGHPAPEIMTVLEEAGVELFVTQTDGDVTIRLD